MNSRLVWLLLLSAVAATAQSTWGGLHFGMSVEDARKLLLGKIQSEDRAAKNPEVLTFTLKPEPLGLIKSTPHIIFKEGVLTRVVLMFSEPASGCSAQRNSELISREIAMIDEVGRASVGVFPEKYGKPINETGTCRPPDINNIQKATQKWH
jgi:hypothetical protein